MPSERLFAIIGATILFTALLIAPAATAKTNEPCNGAEEKTIEYKNPDMGTHIKYTFKFYPETNKYCVLVQNKGEHETFSGFSARVDDRTAAVKMPTLQPGESTYVEKNITEYLDVLRGNHTVTMGVFGKSFTYNFTQKFDATSPEVPSPTIRDVEVVRYQENDSTMLRVSVANPSKRGYGLYVQAKTFGTRRVDDIGAPQPNETVTFTLPLEEGSDAVVAGKVRIFDNWGESESKFDQKEFLSRPGNGTEMWDKPFEHMPGTDSATSYENETSKQYRAGYVDDDYLSERTSKVGAVASVVLLFGLVWWRRR